ncbi:hypothetical protein [Liquorilactobacillus nagelii]|uniref:hypothetical protein n=1 Tax=Liquorilactobacillus nagelii TaxID=82688 RepID=UPI001CCAB4AC|nr:hypothetical protein [Liquorilactobacillus nagelii]ULQ48554.1 hypothetical protein J6864_06040 [Liquorilactobacillus nagelii]
MIWIILLIILCLLFFLVISIHFYRLNQFKKNKTVSDLAVANCLPQISNDPFAKSDLWLKNIVHNSHSVVSFWGNNVDVFAYQFKLKYQFNQLQVDQLQLDLNQLLQEYAKQQQIVSPVTKKPLVVSDCWIENQNNLQLEVAVVVNQATFAYVQDVNRAEQ